VNCRYCYRAPYSTDRVVNLGVSNNIQYRWIVDANTPYQNDVVR